MDDTTPHLHFSTWTLISRLALALAALSAGHTCAVGAVSPATPAERVDFVTQIQPILVQSCLRCHGPDKQRSGYRLDRREAAFKGGDSDEVGVKPHDPAHSSLIQRVTAADPAVRMPPKVPLSPDQVALLERWVADGASWPDAADIAAKKGRSGEMVVTDADRNHWAFRPLRPVSVPAVKTVGWVRTPADQFILTAQEAKGLTPTAEADRRTLVRRLYFDLLGLPPSPDQVAAFVADRSADAYEKLVDQLLASPHYGERWGRHWLDLARYADTAGYELDPERPYSFEYRDWVIRAFNSDLPFDTFVKWQLAGDEYAPGMADGLAATGFLAVGPRLSAGTKIEAEQRRYRADELDDVVSTAGQAFLGLTLGCARCHDHKFDPLPTRDYYRFVATFAGTKRINVQVTFSGGRKGTVHAVVDSGAVAEPSWLLHRGDVMARKELVSFGVPGALLYGGVTEAEYLARARTAAGPHPNSTLQRRAVAEWLTDPVHGAGSLLARVWVNRLWQHHFGQGLVGTPSDFGTQGETPTHPELLDWLASRLVQGGWSTKAVHRLIVLSAAYRQGTELDPKKAALDPENKLLWHRRPVRVEAEALRDAMLLVSGALNPTMFGRGVKPPIPTELLTVKNDNSPYPKDARDEPATRRRSVYLYSKRTVRFPLLELFDGPDPTASCSRRMVTTVAPQALALLNDPLTRARSRDFANRLLAGAGNDPAVVTQAYQLALARDPSGAESRLGTAFLQKREQARRNRGETDARRAAVADFCQVLFGLNEFLFVD